MLKDRKVKVVKELEDRFKSSSVVVFGEYRGMTVKEIDSLRTELEKVSAIFKVVKNTLARIALRNLNIEGFDEMTSGPTSCAFGSGNAIATAKAISDYAAANKLLVLKGGIISNKVMTASELRDLARMGSVSAIYAKMLGAIQQPIYGMVNALNHPIMALVNVLDQISKSKN
jgi:large subunit ribosomal protein L10